MPAIASAPSRRPKRLVTAIRKRPSAKIAGASTAQARHRTTEATPPVLAETEIVNIQR